MTELLAISLLLLPMFLFAYTSFEKSVRLRLVHVDSLGAQKFYFESLDGCSVSPVFESPREAQLWWQKRESSGYSGVERRRIRGDRREDVSKRSNLESNLALDYISYGRRRTDVKINVGSIV